MKFDDVLKQIGEFGPYQKRVYFLAALPVMLSAFEALNVVFTFSIPPHRCAIPGYPDDQYQIIDDTHSFLINVSIPRDKNDGNQWSQCFIYSDVSNGDNLSNSSGIHTGGPETESEESRNTTRCEKWVYDHSVFDATVPTDFNIVCDRKVLRANSNLFIELGAFVGNLVCGLIADRFGRKIPFYIGGLGMIAGGFGIAFVTNMVTLNICRFLLGVARKALWANGLVIGMEIVGPSRRVFAGIVIEMIWCLGMFILLVMAYLIRNWRYLEIALSVPSIGLLAYWCLLPESPRWLASKGRDKEAVQILEKIAASSKTQLPQVDDVKKLLEAETSLSLRHVLRSRELIVRLLIIFANLTAMVIMYYTLTYYMTNLAGDIFINFLIFTVVEALGLSAPFVILDRLGRKRVYCLAVFLGGGACIICVFPVIFNAPAWVIIALALTGRFFVCVAGSVLYIYATELFPTVIRASSLGAAMTISRIGGLIAPYIADAGILVGGKLERALPLMIAGSPMLLAGVFVLWLPETKGTKLPETMEDLKHSKGRCPCGTMDKRYQPDALEINTDEDLRHMSSDPC